MNLSQIKDGKLIAILKNIAKKDGGENPEEIDHSKGYNELCLLLNGSFSRELKPEETEVLMGLKIEYENKYLNKNSNNSVNSVNGNYVIGDGNAVGGDNSINVSGSNNKIYINPKNSNIENEGEYTITPADAENGELIAVNIFNEINSNYALNNVIKNNILLLDKNNAYSFLNKYYSLNQNSQITQDIFKISDIFNRITLRDAELLLNAILEQAEDMGLNKEPAYKNLESHLINIKKQGRNKDPSTEQRIRLDTAIELLYQKMKMKIKN